MSPPGDFHLLIFILLLPLCLSASMGRESLLTGTGGGRNETRRRLTLSRFLRFPSFLYYSRRVSAPHNTITTSSRPSPPIPATSRPSSDLRTPLNDPVGCASSSSANVVSTSALPTWGIWSNKNAASESSGLQLPNAPKSKASEALFDRISKKARLTFPATRSSSGQDQLRGTSSCRSLNLLRASCLCTA